MRQAAIIMMAILLWASVANAAPVAGRIAISSDGNKHDCDDLFATAVSVAILAKSSNASKLRYYGYADHIWASSGGCNGGDRETEMRLSAYETAQKWGGFDLGVFINAKQNTAEAVRRLTALIDESSATDPLWIVAAGPMEVVGRAISASSPSKRQYVTLISHSMWNNDHADKPSPSESPTHSGWTFDEIGRLSPTVVMRKISDQNPDLHTTYSTYYSWRDSSDPKLRWLWDRGQVTGIDWPDCSDAGMVYWLVTGRGADDTVTPNELLALFASSTPPTGPGTPTLLEAEPVVP